MSKAASARQKPACPRHGVEKNERHHGDRMWALALAVHAAGITRQRKRKRKAVTAGIV